MHVETYDASVVPQLKDKILEEGLLFGRTESFPSLVTPSTTNITQKERDDLIEDFGVAWQLYRTANELYLQSLAGEIGPQIKNIAEFGLLPQEVQIQRTIAQTRVEPWSSRIDYISLGDGRKLAEVEWDSDGPGLMLGTQVALSEVIPFPPGVESLGNSVDNFRKMIVNGREGQVVAVNDIGIAFANGEEYMARKYAGTNLTYVPMLRDRFSDHVFRENGDIFIKTGGRTLKVDFFYLFLNPFSLGAPEGDRELYPHLIRNFLEEKLWIEIPPNWIYRAKWALALPFMKEYAHLFPERLRQIMPPTALLGRGLNLSHLADYFTGLSGRDIQFLSGLTSIDDIMKLGKSLRNSLVIKCASSKGSLHTNSRGVYRPYGGKSLGQLIEFIGQRLATGEPWVMQQFISSKYEIPVYLPDQLDTPHVIDAHARFVIFAGRNATGIYPIGGIGNYGRDWKISGKEPSVDSFGEVHGTAMTDIRVEKDVRERTKMAELTGATTNGNAAKGAVKKQADAATVRTTGKIMKAAF